MTWLLWLAVFWAGCFVGIFLMCLMVAARDSDRANDNLRP